jgi:hypothetical protein
LIHAGIPAGAFTCSPDSTITTSPVPPKHLSASPGVEKLTLCTGAETLGAGAETFCAGELTLYLQKITSSVEKITSGIEKITLGASAILDFTDPYILFVYKICHQQRIDFFSRKFSTAANGFY